MNLQSMSFGGVISLQEGSCLIIFLALPVTPVLKMIALSLVAYAYMYYWYMYYLDKSVAMDISSLTFSWGEMAFLASRAFPFFRVLNPSMFLLDVLEMHITVIFPVKSLMLCFISCLWGSGNNLDISFAICPLFSEKERELWRTVLKQLVRDLT